MASYIGYSGIEYTCWISHFIAVNMVDLSRFIHNSNKLCLGLLSKYHMLVVGDFKEQRIMSDRP